MSRDDNYDYSDYKLEEIGRLYLKWRTSQSEEDRATLEARATQYNLDCEAHKRSQEAEFQRSWERSKAEATQQRERNAMLDELIAKRKQQGGS